MYYSAIIFQLSFSFQVYVYQNNIYYVPSVYGEHYPVTNNGVEGVIFNGITDWLYGGNILKML